MKTKFKEENIKAVLVSANRFSKELIHSAWECVEHDPLSDESKRVSHLHSLVILLGLDESLLGNEDSVKEFTLILASNSADLLDLGAGLGESGVVGAVEDKLTLDVGGEGDLSVSETGDDLVLLATKEVLDSDGGAILGDDNIDGEMSVYKSHFVAEAL